MVKREKSPTIRDDAKYLVIYQPYPRNADFDLPGDYIAFAFWVAVVLGSYEPARSTVIVEIDRKMNMSNLLGEHRWKSILKKPNKDEKEEQDLLSPSAICVHLADRVAQTYVPSIYPSLVFKVYRVRDEASGAISVPTTCHLAWDDEEDQHRSSRFSSYSLFSFCFSFTRFSDSKVSSESCECNVPILGRPGGPGSAP
ncbi:hypothetical protein H1R20_g14283, partial [Candolleomyces eurysporus]